MSLVKNRSIGYLRERKDKQGRISFQVCAYEGRINGKCKYRYGRANSKEEAETLLLEMAAEITLGKEKYSTDGNKSLCAFIDEYLELYLEDKKPSTRKSYREHAKLIKAHPISKMSIRSITTANIQMFLNELYKKSTLSSKPLSNRSVLDQQRFLHILFSQAENSRYIEKGSNPVDGTKVRLSRNNNNNREDEIYDEKEIKCLFKALDEEGDINFKAILAIVIETGARRGECIPLKYSDIDYDTKSIHIQRNATIDENGRTVIGSTKTKSSDRKVILSDYTIGLIKQSKAQYLQDKLVYGKSFVNSECILHNKDGSMFEAHSLTQKWRRFCKKYNLKLVKFHGLRKTAASLQLLQGMDPKSVSKNLGHSDIRITLDIYTAITKEQCEENAKKMNKFFEEKII